MARSTGSHALPVKLGDFVRVKALLAFAGIRRSSAGISLASASIRRSSAGISLASAGIHRSSAGISLAFAGIHRSSAGISCLGVNYLYPAIK